MRAFGVWDGEGERKRTSWGKRLDALIEGRGCYYSECSAIWDADREVRDDGKEPVRERRFEREVVRDLMDSEEEVLICRRADDVGRQEEREGEDGRVAEEGGAEDL